MTFRACTTGMGERRHEFLQADGRWKQCGGPRYCRECGREAIARRIGRAIGKLARFTR